MGAARGTPRALLLILAFAVGGTAPVAGAPASPAPTAPTVTAPSPAALRSAPAATPDPCASPLATAAPTMPAASPSVRPAGSPAPSPLPSPAVFDPCAGLPGADPLGVIPPSPSPSPSPSAVPSASPAPSVSPSPLPTASPPPVRPGKVRLRADVAMTPRLPCAEFPTSGCVNRADIYYPENRGAWPTIVTLHGRPRTPADMAELARALAKQGAVVFNIDYRGVRPVSRGFPDSVTDVACAVRFAREKTARYGGNPNHVVVVGHSQGGYVGAMVSLFGDTFPGQADECFASRRTSALPDGFAHLAGVTLNDRDHPVNIIFFGGTFAAIPEVWLRGDLYHRLQGRQRNRDLRVQIVFEMNDPILSDPHATLFQAALRREGYRSKLALLPIGSTHFDILDLDTAIGRTAFQLVERLIERTRPR